MVIFESVLKSSNPYCYLRICVEVVEAASVVEPVSCALDTVGVVVGIIVDIDVVSSVVAENAVVRISPHHLHGGGAQSLVNIGPHPSMEGRGTMRCERAWMGGVEGVGSM